MDIEARVSNEPWRWPLLLSVIFLNVCIPNLVLSYGVILAESLALGLPTWLGLSTPVIFILSYGFSQCWCRDAADSWGSSMGYRVMAAVGIMSFGLLLCTFTPLRLQPFVYGILGGMGSSLISAQVDAVIFETYDSHLGIIRGLCFTGQAIGLSIFPHIITALINQYGHPYVYMLLSGIMLQTLPAIMLLKIEDTVRRPMSFSRYSDISKTYSVFSNGDYYSTELQLHDMSKKCWKSPSDDNLHEEDDCFTECVDNDGQATITAPPSPEERRRNFLGVEILPEIPEESEESDGEEQNSNEINKNKNKKRLSLAIKRLSTMSDNLSDCISKQSRKSSQTSQKLDYESKEVSEIEVTYDNIAPLSEIQREKIFNSFSFRCQSAYASMKRKIFVPSYKMYRMRRRIIFLGHNVNDTFIKPLSRSLRCWRFYPSLLLCFSKLSLTTVFLALLPAIASSIHPTISITDSNFSMTLQGFTWLCFLLCTPWLAHTPKRNYKYIVVIRLVISTVACFIIAYAKNHDMFFVGCVVSGFGYGAISSCWETAVQDFLGPRKWPKIHSTLETLSALTMSLFICGLLFINQQSNDLKYSLFVLGIALSVVTLVWTPIVIISIFQGKKCLSGKCNLF